MNFEYEANNPVELKPADRADLLDPEFHDPFDFKIPVKPVGFDHPWVNQLREQSSSDLVIIYGALQNPFKEKTDSKNITTRPYSTNIKFRALHEGEIIEFIALVGEELLLTLSTLRGDLVIKPEGKVLETLLRKYPIFEILGLDITEYPLNNSLGRAQFTRERLISRMEYAAAASSTV